MRIDLVRHGSTGRAGYLDGRTDPPPLNDGIADVVRQAAGAAWSAIVSSPLRRAREPAESIAASRGLVPLVEDDWAELRFGQWDGLLRTDIEATVEGKAALAAFYSDSANHPPPGGETSIAIESRVARAIDRLLDASRDPVLVVTHAGPMRAAIAVTCGLPYDALWVIRIGYGTRVRLEVGRDDTGRRWGEIVEIVQP